METRPDLSSPVAISQREAAERYSVSEVTIKRLRARGLLTSVHIGASVRIFLDELDRKALAGDLDLSRVLGEPR